MISDGFFGKLPFHEKHDHCGNKYHDIGQQNRNTVFHNGISNPNDGAAKHDEKHIYRNVFH